LLQSNRWRQAWEVLVFRCMAFYLQGNISECLIISEEVQQVISENLKENDDDPEIFPTAKSLLWWNKTLHALILIHRQPIDSLYPLLTEIQSIKIQHDDTKWTENKMLQQILFQAINCFLLCRETNYERMLVCAEDTFNLLLIPKRTLYFSTICMATTLISYCVIESAIRTEGKQKLLYGKSFLLAKKLGDLLKRFSKQVPFVVPRALICEGVLHCLEGNLKKGHEFLHSSEIHSIKTNMPMERALAVYYKCLFTPTFSLQDSLLSESIFRSIGADYEADLAKALIC